MYRVRFTTGPDTIEADYATGPVEFGRGPGRDGIPRVIILDPTVSRDHVRIGPADRGVRVENLSQRMPIHVGGINPVPPGGSAVVLLPLTLLLGETRVEVAVAPSGLGAPPTTLSDRRPTTGPTAATPYPPPRVAAEPPSDEPPLSALDSLPATMNILETVLQVKAATFRPDGPSAAPPSATTLANWFEAIIAVQTAPPGSAAAFDQAARAVVELIGLHTGLLLLGSDPAWHVAARFSRADDWSGGREYSTSVLRRVAADRRTFFQGNAGKADITASLTNVGAVVASPVLGGDGRLLGVLYGSRPAWASGRGLTAGGIGPLEAHAMQLLATTVGVGLDHKAEQERATEMRAQKEAAEAADRAKGQFLALVSHELRTPLTAILGYAELLIETATDDGAEHLVPDLAHIKSSGTHLLTLINDLLDLSKIEAGKFSLSPEPFDLEALLAETARTVRPLMDANANAFETTVPPDLGTVTLDPVRVRQCVLNLLGNAAKFTRKGTVRLAAERTAERINVTVTDTGIGIPPDRLAALFQPFEQADAAVAKKFGGTGLGLAICRRLARMMGGDVTAASVEGTGSTFTLDLPVT